MTFWTAANNARLCVLWDHGLTASEIMREMNAPSRNAVIGKARRLGLPGRISLVPAQPKAIRVRQENAALRQIRIKPSEPTAAPPPDLLVPLGTAEWPAAGLCRYGYGKVGQPGFAFCARPVGDRPYRDKAPASYCRDHADRCYQRKPYRKSGWSGWKEKLRA